MTPELLKAHAAKRAEEYAEGVYEYVPAKRGFLAGHQEALEIGKLLGKIEGLDEGLKTQGEAGPYRSFLLDKRVAAHMELERLLSPDNAEAT